MKKEISHFVFCSVIAFFLAVGIQEVFAAETVSLRSGDYEIIPRRDKDEGEILYRLNNKTGETWILETRDAGWRKIKEQA